MSVQVRVVDKGLNDLLKRVGKKARLKVGVYGDNAARAATDGSGATVGDIASAHEFGTATVPVRSWLRATVDQDLAKINAAIKKAAAAVYAGKVAPRAAVDLLGHGLVSLTKDRIIGGIQPALSPRYLPIKLARYPGATTPLIASSQFLGSITHTIEGGE